MTQHTKIVEKQKEKLKQERLDNTIIFIEVTFKNGKWNKEITGYNSGRIVTKYNDKRKKEIVEYEL